MKLLWNIFLMGVMSLTVNAHAGCVFRSIQPPIANHSGHLFR